MILVLLRPVGIYCLLNASQLSMIQASFERLNFDKVLHVTSPLIFLSFLNFSEGHLARPEEAAASHHVIQGLVQDTGERSCLTSTSLLPCFSCYPHLSDVVS
jgi:hypothetical protein